MIGQKVALLWHEYAMASEIGRLRQLAAIRRSSTDNHGFDGLGWSEHIEGACGELVVCKYLRLYWNGGIDTFKGPDADIRIQVRTRSKHEFELIVRNDDNDDDIFVLVTGRCPNYIIRGFMLGRDAKQRQYLQAYGGRPPAFFVPQVDLHEPWILYDKFH